jgi:hypothetical protein
MRRLLREFYRKLPIIREISRIEHYNYQYTKDLLSVLRSIRRLQIESVSQSLLSQERYQDPKRLARFEHQVHSQNGEDGIIAEIFRRIGTKQ